MTRFTHVSCFALLAALAAAGCCHRGRTVEVRASMIQDGLRVSGQGEARGQPDVARATLGVEARAASAGEANDQVSRAMRQVIDAVKAQGVAEQDIQTEQITVHFEQEYVPYPPQPRPLPQGPDGHQAPPPEEKQPRGFYRAANTVRVTIRNLDRASAVLGAATGAGANAVHGLSFDIDDPAPLLEQARAKAVEDARRQAEQLASLAGTRLGRVIAVSAQSHGHIGPMRAATAPMAMKEHADVPVEPGELVVQQHVEIVYALDTEE